MKKTKLTRSLLAACSVVALSVALSGCLHSGDDPVTTDDTPVVDPPMVDGNLTLDGVTAGEAIMPGTYSVDSALAAAFADAPEGLAGVEHAMGTTVMVGGVNLTCAMGPCQVDVNDDNTVTVTGTIHTADYTPPPTDEEIAAEIMAATAQAASKRTQIAAEGAQTTAAGLGGSARVNADGTDGNADDPYTLAVSRDADSTTVEITVPGAAMTDPEFMQAMDLGDGVTMHTRTMMADDDGDVMSEVVMVRTTIEAPDPTPFNDAHALDLSTDTTNDGDTGADDDIFEALNIGEAITNGGADADAAIYGRVMSSSFVLRSGEDNTLEFTFDNTDTGADEAAEVSGTYDGAMGTYRCNGTAECTVVLNDDGMVTSMTGDWIFTPIMGAMAQVADTDYLSYGFWLQRTTDSDGAVTYDEVETFAMSSIDPSVGTVLDDVNGSATYTGDALGVYVRDVYTSGGGTIESATSGHFTADVSLTATFGQLVVGDNADSIAPNMLNTVTGSISNFVLSGGEENDWGVNVMASRADNANTFSGTANGGGAEGSIDGTYYGVAVIDNDGTADMDESVLPSSIAGEFNANFSNGTVAGAFGAERD